jgi:hypothetical protein
MRNTTSEPHLHSNALAFADAATPTLLELMR